MDAIKSFLFAFASEDASLSVTSLTLDLFVHATLFTLILIVSSLPSFSFSMVAVDSSDRDL